MENNKPLVSICCITYNHEGFIRDALEGFIAQKTVFPFEIIIHDDASTDRTPEIINEYTTRYPDLIYPLLQKENQYSKNNGSLLVNFVMPKVRGKYIAICEGDDYWTDPYKLQKQTHFLETNPEYAVCVGGYTQLVQSSQEMIDIIKCSNNKDLLHDGFTFSLIEMRNDWITKTLTALIRKDILEKIDFSVYKHTRDIHIFYHIVKTHKAYYFSEIFGVYRIHEGGINSMKKGEINSNAAYNCYKELFEHNKDEFTRIMNRDNTLALFNYNIYHRYSGNTCKRNMQLFFEAVKLTQVFKEVKHLFAAFIPIKIKDKLREL
jgi:glycosyltransferase involved in cell wall biosynthesis